MADIPVSPGITPAGPRMGPGPAEGADALFVALSAGFTVLSHPLLYVKLLVQVRFGGNPPVQVSKGRRWLVSCVGTCGVAALIVQGRPLRCETPHEGSSWGMLYSLLLGSVGDLL